MVYFVLVICGLLHASASARPSMKVINKLYKELIKNVKQTYLCIKVKLVFIQFKYGHWNEWFSIFIDESSNKFRFFLNMKGRGSFGYKFGMSNCFQYWIISGGW